jgi:serine/threonine-protein kinase RsbW
MAAEGPSSYSVVTEGKASAITDVCSQILSHLEDTSFSQDDVFAVHLALEEAFINAIKHGNKMDPAKTVQIDYSIDSDRVEILMTDQGDGFDPDSVPDPRIGDNLYKPEGRGLLLMNSYMDVVEFNERGNRVRMVRYKEKPDLTKRRARA